MSNKDIFRDYDIRGVVPRDLNPEVARRLGAGFVRLARRLEKKRRVTILVARDFRASSESLGSSFMEGAVRAGGRMVDAGVLSFPETAFYLFSRRQYDAVVYVTASHDPRSYNGFKLLTRTWGQVGRARGLMTLMSEKQEAVRTGGTWTHSIQDAERYRAALHRIVTELPKWKILVDAGGGTATGQLPKILGYYRLVYQPLFLQPDPNFRHHPPNPLDPKVGEIIRSHWRNEELGFVFDGDADRLAVYDSQGLIRQDVIFALLAAEILKKHPRASFVYDVTHGSFLRPFIEAYGGKLFVSQIGRPHIQAEMKRRKALLGGEFSGHMYHHDLFDIDSAALTMLRVLEAAGKLAEPLRSFGNSLTTTAMVQKNVQVQDADRVMAALRRRHTGYITSDLDGIAVHYPTWWFNIRSSNTESGLVRITVEAESERGARDRIRELEREMDL